MEDDLDYTSNTIGPSVPLQWYSSTMDHIGYTLSGQRFTARNGLSAVDAALLNRGSDAKSKEFRRSVYDERQDEVIAVTDRELTMVRRMMGGRFPRPEFDGEEDYVPYYSGIAMPTEWNSSQHEPKRRFLPSKWERLKVERLIQGLKDGTVKPSKPEEEGTGEDEFTRSKPFMLWGEDGAVDDEMEILKRKRKTHGGSVPAPKQKPPGHEESYHPPEEYVSKSEEELKDLTDRGRFVPKDLEQMRKVGAYPNFVRERFERCLDLYLCVRQEKQKLNIDPESLVPRLPLPKELRPFPTTSSVQYLGHQGRVRSLAVDPRGEYLATGGDDGDLRLWDVESGRCVSVLQNLGGDDLPILRLVWNPKMRGVLACAKDDRFHIVYLGSELALPGIRLDSNNEGAMDITDEFQATCDLLSGKAMESVTDAEEPTKSAFSWMQCRDETLTKEFLAEHGSMDVLRCDVEQGYSIVDLTWHSKGEFLCSVASSSGGHAGRVAVHHVGRRKTQQVLTQLRGDPQCAVFHPAKPVLFVATKTHVVAHHLTKQSTVKRLRAGVKWISSICIHPKGDHVVIGSFDCRVVWFDLDLSDKPFKTMKYHGKAVRRVCFHKRYPLLASGADDGNLNVFHATVYDDDYTRNPLIVPVKRIEAHDVVNGRGVADAVFHPTQPWLFSAGADGIAVLFSNVP